MIKKELHWFLTVGALAISGAGAESAFAQSLPNACPVDGCEVKIVSAERAGSEVKLIFEANFTPDVSKNHFHVWWGELYKVKQVGRNAESEYGVKQGRWHRHDDNPEYITTGAASTTERGDATTLCVTAADRGHNVLDPTLFHCMDVSGQL